MARLFVAVLSALARVRQPAHRPGEVSNGSAVDPAAEEASEFHSICLPLLQADRTGQSPVR